MRNIEQEIKLKLSEREYGILLGYSDVQPQLQTNYYFAWQNMPRNVMLRIRKKEKTIIYVIRIGCLMRTE